MKVVRKNERSKYDSRIKTSLCWFVGFMVAGYGYWLVMTNFVIRNFWDPQYAMKADLLRERLAEKPGNPLWVVLGSSRVDDGVKPDVMEDMLHGEKAPLLFNFGMSGSDLFRELIILRRLISDGMKPQRVGIEILPPLLSSNESSFISAPSLLVRMRHNELEVQCSHSFNSKFVCKTWMESRTNPIFKWGTKVEMQTMPAWRLLPVPFLRQIGDNKNVFDKWGWCYPFFKKVSREDYFKGIQAGRRAFGPSLKDFKVTKNNDQVLREILDLCKQSDIDAFLLLMPESIDFQSIYPDQANKALESLVNHLKSDYGVVVINARSWIAPDGFIDGHHLLASGAEAFTRQFVEELFKTAKQQAAH